MTWFPVHCTSINNTNSLISGDNKGAASQMFERHAHDRCALSAAGC
jgi:neutral ceramidase